MRKGGRLSLIYNNVISYCRENGISVSGFEKKCGIANGIVSRWKDNESKPNFETLEKISKATKIEISKWIK
jgi:transcriptional regulator with XRE-family HTH domain